MNDSKKQSAGVHEIASASVAAVAGLVLRDGAHVVYESVGKEILSEAAQSAVARVVVNGSAKLIENAVVDVLPEAAKELAPFVRGGVKQLTNLSARGSAKVLTSGGKAALSAATAEGAKTASIEVAKSAGKEVLKGAGKAVGVGFAVDAVFGAIEAVQGLRSGSMNGKQAVVHVAKEATGGAIATAVGAAACAGLVALTGPLGVGVLLVVGAGTSFGVKQAFRSLVT